MKYKLISIDLAKNVFQVAVFAHNKKIRRNKLLDVMRQYEPTTACYENYWRGSKIRGTR